MPGAEELSTECAIWSVPGGSVSGSVVAGSNVTSPSWKLPNGSAASAGDGWLYQDMTGASVTLTPGTYKVSVYDGNVTPQTASTKILYYWGPDGQGYGGLSSGPITVPDTAHANLAWEWDGSDPGATPPYSNGTQEAGQSTFAQNAAPMAYPFLYVDGLYQNYLVDIEVIPNANTVTAGSVNAVASAYAPSLAVSSFGTGTASVSATAYLPTIIVDSAATGNGSASATAHAPSLAIAATGGLAAASATAYQSTLALGFTTGLAGASAVAYQPNVTTGANTTASAGLAPASVTAYNPSVSTTNVTSASAGLACASATAAVALEWTVSPPTAAVSVTAYDAVNEPLVVEAIMTVSISVDTDVNIAFMKGIVVSTISVVVQGNIATCTVGLTNASTGAMVDPTTITFYWEMARQPGTEASFSYTGSNTPQPGTFARISQGLYVAQVDLTNVSGVLIWQVVSTGTGQAAGFGQLTVTPLPIPIG